MAESPSDLVAAVLGELAWIAANRGGRTMQELAVERFNVWSTLAVQIRSEDLGWLMADVAHRAGFTDTKVWGFAQALGIFCIGMGALMARWESVENEAVQRATKGLLQ